MDAEQRYISRRKCKAFLYSLVYYACRIFSVKRNKIVMWTFEGNGGYGCSPRYIAEELRRRGDAFEIVWLVDHEDTSFPPNIRTVKSTLWSRAYHLSTAGYWISNTRTFFGTKKRRETTYLQTWHGTVSLKPIGKFRGEKFSKIAYLVSAADSKLIDYALSGSRWCTEMWPDGLVYDGKILETGTPRCDVFYTNMREKRRQLREAYGLPRDANILIYAPTFRGGSQSTVRRVRAKAAPLDFGRLTAVLEQRFGGTWYIFLRLHPQLAAQMKRMPVHDDTGGRLIDVSQRPDMNEIMAATDAIITDYSTVIFEGFLTGQPGFIYADDLEEYIADRGGLMFSMDEIPFPVAKNNDELLENIRSFDAIAYENKRRAFIKKAGMIEDGHASERIVDLIEKIYASR